MKIDKIEINESKEHKEAKLKLFKRLVDNRVTFINQFGAEFNVTPNKTWTNLYMEAYVYSDDKNFDPYLGSPCVGCFLNTNDFIGKIDKNKECIYADSIKHCLENRFIEDELNGISQSNNSEINAFTQHPCSICKYKGKLDCIAIFDIAGSTNGNAIPKLNGRYTIAIEIVKTSRCSENKIKFCKDNNIWLLEVSYEDVLNLKENEMTLSCVSMWWVEKHFSKYYKKMITY